MTISTTTARYSYSGNGVTTDFAYSSKFLANGDLVVVLVNDTTGVETIKTLTTHYTVTGAGAANGGTVTMLTPPASGESLVIYGDPALTQSVDLVEGDDLAVETQVEAPLDRLTLICQRIKNLITRSIRLPDGDTSGATMVLPAEVDRASKALGFDADGEIEMFDPASAVTAGTNITFLQSGTGAVSRTAQDKMRDAVSVLDYGVVAGDSSAATRTANTTALRKLVSSTANGGTFDYKGRVVFPLGSTYYFDSIIPLKDGIYLDLCGSTIHFSKSESTAEDAAGFFYARRDCVIENGYIEVDYTATVANRGSAIKLNARYADSDQGAGQYFLNNFEEDQASGGTGTGAGGTGVMTHQPGNIYLRNLRIKSNNPHAPIIQMFGGLKGVAMENVYLDGQSLALTGIDYEFGGATDETLNENEKSSHGENFYFRNIEVKDVIDASGGAAIGIRGAYNVTIDGLVARNCMQVLSFSTGEAANYNPGDLDVAGVKRNNYFRNIVGQGITGTAISINGITDWSGYLSPLAVQTQTDVEPKVTDLIEATVENFVLTSSGGGGQGVSCSGHKIVLRNGRITGFASGVFDGGTRHFTQENVDILDSVSSGMRILNGSIYPSGWTDRHAYIRGGVIAGNSTRGILFESGQVNAIVEDVTFGYNRPATGRITVTGGTASAGVNKLSTLTVNGVNILNAAVDWVTSNTATAAAIAASINTKTSVPDYTATSVGAEVLIRALPGTGTTPNGFVVLPTVGGNLTVGNIKDMSGGKVETTQTASVSVSSGIQNVTVRKCNTRAVAAGLAAYHHQDSTDNNCRLINNLGDVTTSGCWRYNGKLLEANIASGSPVSLVSTTEKTISSITLTAGTWDATGVMPFTSGGTTDWCQASWSLTDNSADDKVATQTWAAGTSLSTGPAIVLPTRRFTVTQNTTIYAIGREKFSVSGSAYGNFRATMVLDD